MRNPKDVSSVVALIILAASAAPLYGQKFEPTWGSLQQYECPQWFRDAKLGIFMHWGPCSVPGVDSWYGRNMYIEGHRTYKHHLKTYGHPSNFGYKDIIGLWKAERFDPDRLVRLYKRAGAKYVVPVAVHHDNFDLWDSKHHRWNAANMGPKKDIIGMWREATLKHGLRFGASVHLARSYSWFNTSKGSDKSGRHAGVPYDGNDTKYADLYHEKHDDTSYRYPSNPPEAWKRNWYDRVNDLVDKYQPDLLYFDGGVPFGEVGRQMVAYYFNQNMQWHGGKLEAVFNIKNIDDGHHGEYRDGMCVLDLERGVLSGIRSDPWQNDTSIGPWYYITNARYKSADAVVDSFVDIVSKNGNLLLNVPPKPDGTLDTEAETILVELGKWMDVNGEAIYGSRPWKTCGEGPTAVPEGYFKERTESFSPQDVRFTTKGNVLYAICLGWPGDGATVAIKSLSAREELGKITKITLLGYDGDLKWSRDDEGLKIRMPSKKPCENAYSFRIEFAAKSDNGERPATRIGPARHVKPDPVQATTLISHASKAFPFSTARHLRVAKGTSTCSGLKTAPSLTPH
ncbi:alpha-L-fucosidase [bacterium]|nr:alpha-L-fucosidase [bacterium]